MRRYVLALLVAAAASSAAAQNNCVFPSATCSSARFFAKTNGTASAPAYSFAADPNTGMYRSAEEEISFATNGTSKLLLSESVSRFSNAAGSTILDLSNGTGLVTLPWQARIGGPSGTTVVPLEIRGAPSQSANLLELNLNGGPAVASVNPSGLGTLAGVNVTGTTVPSNGLYLIAPNAPALSSNGTGRVRWDDTGFYPVTDGAVPLGKTGAGWGTVSISGKTHALALPGTNATGRLDVDTETDELYFDTGARWRNVGSAAHYTIDKRFIADYALFESTASPANLGAAALTVTDAAAATTGATSNRDYRMSNTAASSGSTSSLVSATRTGRGRGPRWSAWVKTGSNITSTRLWAGLTFASNSMTDDGTASRDYVLFRYSTNASDTTWKACSGDALNATSCSDTGVSVTADTEYLLEIDCRNSAACVYWVNGIPRIRKTTNLPATGSDLKTWFSVEALSASARSFGFSNQTLETN